VGVAYTLPGFSRSETDMVPAALAYFASGYDVLPLPLPGHPGEHFRGRASEIVPGRKTRAEYPNFLDDLLEIADLSPSLALSGQSFGATLLLEAAIQFIQNGGDGKLGLTVPQNPYLFPSEGKERTLQRIQQAEHSPVRGLVDGVVDSFHFPLRKHDHPDYLFRRPTLGQAANLVEHAVRTRERLPLLKNQNVRFVLSRVDKRTQPERVEECVKPLGFAPIHWISGVHLPTPEIMRDEIVPQMNLWLAESVRSDKRRAG
jgi:hypothetical protein